MGCTVSKYAFIINTDFFHMSQATVMLSMLVYDLKFIGSLEVKLVAPMPEQIKTTMLQFYEASTMKTHVYLLTPQGNTLW